ncbi:hypothetical protein CPLU01_10017 [Colletotrichum plurivorum]|uniref:Uncharacterized protein n=1 Tax=Colletotrichum plurivorum TaxID=2175906 RepID=A0A8H6K6U6_9PEZI|nr:hypothetical protein CPLU01_10017 [Colletotrichum plurivorum]
MLAEELLVDELLLDELRDELLLEELLLLVAVVVVDTGGSGRIYKLYPYPFPVNPPQRAAASPGHALGQLASSIPPLNSRLFTSTPAVLQKRVVVYRAAILLRRPKHWAWQPRGLEGGEGVIDVDDYGAAEVGPAGEGVLGLGRGAKGQGG